MNYENTTFILQISKSGFSQKPPTEVEGACVVNNWLRFLSKKTGVILLLLF